MLSQVQQTVNRKDTWEGNGKTLHSRALTMGHVHSGEYAWSTAKFRAGSEVRRMRSVQTGCLNFGMRGAMKAIVITLI